MNNDFNGQVVAVVCCGQSYGIPDNKSFFHVSRAAEKIAGEALLAYVYKDYVTCNLFQEAYHRFLSLCGWSEKNYDRKMLEVLDSKMLSIISEANNRICFGVRKHNG
jgi:hypothetical protein